MNIDTDSQWVIRLPVADAEKVGSLRMHSGLRVLANETSLWVQGDSMNSDVSRRIRSLPDAEWFNVRPDRQLVRNDATVPCARLPEGSWQPLQEWLKVELPRAGFARSVTTKLMLNLVRSSFPVAANLLQTSWADWFRYAQSAPQVRLNRWAFARSNVDRVLIWGTPLPPIPGRQFVEMHGVIIPAGWRFEPSVGPLVVRQVVKLDDSEMVLFFEEGSFERLPRSAFVQARRSAVRATNGR